jgi:NitT/TauT family transport system substrate-binding protein
MSDAPKLTVFGSLFTLVLVAGLISLGVWLVMRPAPPAAPNPVANQTAPSGQGATAGSTTNLVATNEPPDPNAPKTIEPATSVVRLDAAAPYTPKGGVLDISISEYAGYAGLIAANGGKLEPNPESLFAKRFGFQVRLTRAEVDLFSDVNSGKLAALATTVDTLAVLGRQFNVTVPVQIGFSRGADGIIVRSDIPSLNALRGQVISAAQFNETDFLIRYLAGEAGIPVQVLPDLTQRPAADRIGVVFCEDAFSAANLFASELKRAHPRLAGCIGWAPRIYEVLDASQGKARLLVSNKNLLLVADILVFNRAWAAANPAQVAGVVHGLIAGNQEVRDHPEAHLAELEKAFGWKADQAKAELARVHLSNLPENRAFFGGTIDAAGSFSGIFQSAVAAYGSQLIPNPADPDRFLDAAPLTALEASGEFKDQRIAIAPIRSNAGAPLEGSPLLSKDIRFFFQPNSSQLDLTSADNTRWLESIRSYLQVSPGSLIVLRGHVDNARVEEFRKQGGEPLVKSMALKAMELSKQRAAEVKKVLIERLKLDPNRLEAVGRGWEEPAGPDADRNRRVEVQWFTLE